MNGRIQAEAEKGEIFRETLHRFCPSFSFPPQAEESLAADLDRLLETSSAFSGALSAAEKDYLRKGSAAVDWSELLSSVEKLAEKAGVSPYAAGMLLAILLSPALLALYRKEGIPEEIYTASMADLCCKLYECRRVYGVWGSFVASWFLRFFRLALFGIGRLEFAPYRAKESDILAVDALRAAGAPLPKIAPGALLLDTHIPSRGRLPHEEVLAAYRQAAAFFRRRFDLSGTAGRAVFLCESWMLDPGHFSLPGMEKCQNLLAFQKDYTLLRSGEDREGEDLWRIFGRPVSLSRESRASLAALPEDTALQRAYKRRLLHGELPGYGVGIFLLPEEDGCEAY